MSKPTTLASLQTKKRAGVPITMLTAYDYPTARLLDNSSVDILLVGDSVGMVVHGFDTTLPVTMDMMVLHTQAVRRGARRALVVADMPFMSYQAARGDALRNAGRLLAEGGADAVKLEGGAQVTETVERMVAAGIAVMGHLGLTPQSVSAFGGFKTQGKTLDHARRLIDDAHLLERAGVFAIVLEAIPAPVAGIITRTVNVPTIGIGAGPDCDGQVLVIHDVLGLYDRVQPRFVKQYAQLGETIQAAVAQYVNDVQARAFPAPEHTFDLDPDVLAILAREYGG